MTINFNAAIRASKGARKEPLGFQFVCRTLGGGVRVWMRITRKP